MFKINFNKKGMTLIEVVVAIGIFILILFILWHFYFSYYQVFNFQQATSKMAGSASLSANELQSAVLQADKVIASRTISGNVFTTDQDTLILEIPSIDSSGNILSSKYDYVVFYANGSNFYKQTEADASSARVSSLKSLSSMLSNISFTYDNGDPAQVSRIDIDMQMQTTVNHQMTSYELQEKLYLRNF